MQSDPDDLTPEQRGDLPSPETLRARERRDAHPLGRWLRSRSWLTILVAILAVGACLFLFENTR